jgi:anti-sigma regulatory factor (Ser/Thr protein kinase)
MEPVRNREPVPNEHVTEFRRFNRYFTRRIGALDDHYLGQDRPLDEARLLFEIRDGASLRELRGRLGLDAGYLSRMARALEAQGMVRLRVHPRDSRLRMTGGDWFDVIPLSGARVALVVGDVVGHGLHASASMGRLRTAVRTLADVDLPPDELLTHMDDLVLHLASDLQPTGHFQPTGETGATCLYAVYDPVSRRLTLASAGHPLPLIISPDGTSTPVPAQPGPLLGIGGLPFEATELELPEGSLLALYTDGLVESRERDVDQRTTELQRALDPSATSLEALCDTVMDAMLPDRRTDDAALLLVRTHALDPHHVADWDVEPDTAQVPRVRKLAVDQASAWGLEEAAFVTELVVSELVTNAIRYGEPPIRLRLIRDTSLICEVSDASSTAPHLRRARAFDEGGRGLLLVAQLTQGWGTRHTDNGKTIWCAQTLPASGPS